MVIFNYHYQNQVNDYLKHSDDLFQNISYRLTTNLCTVQWEILPETRSPLEPENQEGVTRNLE